MRSQAQHRLGRVEAVRDGDASAAAGTGKQKKTLRTTRGPKEQTPQLDPSERSHLTGIKPRREQGWL